MKFHIEHQGGDQYIVQLDGLRGVAILLVMLTHCIVPPESGWVAWGLRNAVSLGWIGVDLFFAISGYLITAILLRSRSAPHFFRNFYARRLLRIVPLYSLLVIFATIVSPALPYGRFGPVWPYLTFTSNLWGLFHRIGVLSTPSGYSLLAHLWSLGIEMQFYLVFPFVVYTLDRRRLRQVLWLVLLVSPLMRWLVNQVIAPGQSYFVTWTRLDALMMGGLFALYSKGEKEHSASLGDRVGKLAGILIGATLLLWVSRQTNFEKPVFNLIGLTIVDGAAAMTTMSAVLQRGSFFDSLLQSRPLAGIGRVSYGMYMIHYPLLVLSKDFLAPTRLGQGWLGTAVLAFVSMGGSFLLARASWRFIEKPFLRLKVRF
jgi:peptidoglycan/LPS O-acetylase OafA/YrhL